MFKYVIVVQEEKWNAPLGHRQTFTASVFCTVMSSVRFMIKRDFYGLSIFSDIVKEQATFLF